MRIWVRRRICWFSLLLVFWSVAVCEAAAPGLVGVWQGSAPAKQLGLCFNEKITLTITRQCGNLFRGRATVAGTTLDFVGSIKGGTTIAVHGYRQGYDFIYLTATYQAGSPARINVTYIGVGDPYEKLYDAFAAPYSGAVPNSLANTFDLLLLSN